MTPLQSHKQLLLAESDLNRAHMAEDIVALREEIQALKDRTKSLGSIASTVGMVAAGLSAFRRNKPAEPPHRSAWWQIALKGVGMISTLWMAVRARE